MLYTVYIWVTKNRSGVSVDRASDNVYYLGLLFTLTSLAYSLIKLTFFDMTKSMLVLSLLPDFGLALFSTITGIFGRIILQQMRNDPRDIETEAREELGIAMKQLRETLGEVTLNLNDLSEQMKVSLIGLNHTVSQTIEQTASENMRVIKNVTEEVASFSSTLKIQASEVTASASSATEQFKFLLEQVSNQMNKFPKLLSEKFTQTSSELMTLTENIQTLAMHHHQLAKQTVETVSTLNDIVSDPGLREIPDVLTNTKKIYAEISNQLQTHQVRLSETMDSLSTQTSGLSNTIKSIGEYSQKMDTSAEAVDEANNQYVEELVKAAQTLRKKTDNI